ncbi:MAG: aminoglycoside phosphotransferase family protein [Rickettsiales bacterium]
MTLAIKTRPERGDAMDEFLNRIGWKGAERRMLAGDASFRRYERVHFDDRIAVLMDAPPPWEDVRPFIAVTDVLGQCGVTVPTIIAQDEGQGFLLLEDLGDVSFTRLLKAEPKRESEIYSLATDALIVINLASQAMPVSLATSVPPYDMAVYLREAALFAEWFLPQIHGIEKAMALREEYLEIWREILTKAQLKQSCLVHRDYHADNLFWLEGREDYHAVGMIDYQDALWGDPAYDLASLLEDARRDVAETAVAECFARYSTAVGENAQAFAARFSIIAAQRNAKIIGIFSRLCVRDGKANYLDYLPRVWGHFTGDLAHPMMKPLKKFVDTHVPVEWRGSFSANTELGGIAL